MNIVTHTHTYMQLSKMTEKVQKISKQLSTEKALTEQLQKSTSSQMTQQISDNRKMALEISKLKVLKHNTQTLMCVESIWEHKSTQKLLKFSSIVSAGIQWCIFDCCYGRSEKIGASVEESQKELRFLHCCFE